MTTQSRINEVTSGATSISKDELISKMINVRGGAHTFSNVVLKTAPTMNKGGNPFHNRVEKLAQWNCGINTEYGTKLGNTLDKLGIEVEALDIDESRYERYTEKKNCPVLRLKSDPNKIYIAFFPNKQVQFVEYYIDGELATPLESEQLKVWIKKSTPSKKQTELGIAEADQVIIRTAKVESVVAIKIDGIQYRVV
jgi:hypothetical protein